MTEQLNNLEDLINVLNEKKTELTIPEPIVTTVVPVE